MKTILFDKLDNNKVKCGMCNHFCVIEDGNAVYARCVKI